MVREPIAFVGDHNNRIAGECYHTPGASASGVVLLLHGGGQTRHSWGGTAAMLADRGWMAIVIDQRGHGDSDWHSAGDYEFSVFADDLRHVARQIQQRFGRRPVCIGASLGGLAAMIAEGESAEPVLEALVLVDVTPTLKREGVAKILGFMGENANHGFASLEEAADAIAAYLPHRPRPSSLSGLAKNLRLHDDGRYRWHWDPAFLRQRETPTDTDWQTRENRLVNAASQLRLPVLLVRGQQSELVDMAAVHNCLSLIPHAQFADVHNAGHMVAGDKNDVFGDAVVTFLDTLGHDHRNHQS